MAEADPLLRVRIAALRAIEVDSVEDRRRAHYDALNRDFGLDPDSKKARARQARRRRLPRQFMRLIIVATTVAGLWFGVPDVLRMWNAGAYDGYAASLQRATPRPKGNWIGTRLPDVPSTRTPSQTGPAKAEHPNFMEQALQAASTPPPAATPPPPLQVEAEDDSGAIDAD